MIPIKRPLDNSFNHAHDDKRRNIQTTTDQSYCSSEATNTHFEDFSNELLYEIFEYLDYFHVYQTFPSLNQRFSNLIINSNIPMLIKTSLSSMSLSTFEHYNQDIIQSNTSRITSIYCSDTFMYDSIFLSMPRLSAFQRLETLILYDIESKYLKGLLDQLQSLPFLSSLVICSCNRVRDINLIYRQIFRLPALKYCQLDLVESNSEPTLAVCTNDYSSIEHLIIVNSIRRYQLRRLLSYVPKLRRLSIKSLTETWMVQKQSSTNLVNHLTHLSLKITSLTFDYLVQLIKDFFHTVQILHITVKMLHLYEVYINANRWEQLITHHLLKLRVFDIYIEYFMRNISDQLRIEKRVKEFSSSFWMERQWFFTHRIISSCCFLFYSTNPYRRKYYTLSCEQQDRITTFNQDIFNPQSIQRVYIKGDRIIGTCNNYFPNATELIFENIFFSIGAPVDSLLSRIVPLKQLTKVAIECNYFFFIEVIKILRYAPNVRVLKLRTMTLYQHENDYTSIERSEDFQLVSQTNNIRTVILDDICTTKQVKLLVILCPRIHHLMIYIDRRDLATTIRFLLEKNNPNARHLYALRWSNCCDNDFENVNMLIKSEKLLDEYKLLKTSQYFYLWW